MTLPKRLEIKIPPAITAVAEAAVGRDAVMKAVASAVLQVPLFSSAFISSLGRRFGTFFTGRTSSWTSIRSRRHHFAKVFPSKHF